MARKKQEYNNESIVSLKGADRVRLRPAVIFGSDGIEGCCHSVFEILSNSIDEAREGYGREIILTQYQDHSISVEDFGRGIPVDFNANENCYNYELLFCELYAGGKYNNNSAENYEFSLGLNGLGLCATQYASEYMDVVVYRDGFRYELHFAKGELTSPMKKEETRQKKTGTFIKWRPDLEVFTDIAIPADYFETVLKKQAIVNRGLRFLLRQEGTQGFSSQEFYYENGIVDYVQELSGENTLCPVQYVSCERTGRDRADKEDYRVKMEIAFTFSNQVSACEYYHNSSFLEHGGSPDKAVRSAFLWEMDAFLKQNNKYNKNESKISVQDVLDSLVIVTNSFSTQTSYENQTKKAINNKFIQDAMNEFLRSQLEIFFIENNADALRIGDQILINKRSRENAEKARVAIKKKLSGSLDMQNRVQKFVDCRSKDVFVRELFIVEGDSALSSCKMARDATFQAIIPVRGKILNCLKAEYDKIFKSDIITDLIKVLGCGVEVKTKKGNQNAFDLDALRWNKIIICTDADVDGFQIRTLILTMLYRLTPTLIERGKVYIAESPLYEINTKKETYFAYNEKEKQEILSRISGKCEVNRSKGLGENDPDMMWKTTMCPETRRLVKILPEDREETEKMFDLLLGDNLQGRKDYIAENGHLYLDELDLS
ncbi:MAG: DNA gyrase/topoisomerase IV subunit B [Eubacteriales bacterium]